MARCLWASAVIRRVSNDMHGPAIAGRGGGGRSVGMATNAREEAGSWVDDCMVNEEEMKSKVRKKNGQTIQQMWRQFVLELTSISNEGMVIFKALKRVDI